MATLHLQRALHRTCQCLFPRIPKRANPGIGYQIQEFNEDEQLSADPEGFGDIESDLMNVHHLHREHEAELQKQRDRVRHFMIKHKYFRDQKLPNLLTYAEKEQIRLLHQRDPEEWDAERLAECFPATPTIIQKILRAKWRPRTPERIKTHDESVMRNWDQLRRGQCEIQIPDDLLEHIKKFSDRNASDLLQLSANNWPTRKDLPKPSSTEFQSLITSCKKYGSINDVARKQKLINAATQLREQPNDNPTDEETYLLDKVQDKRRMRLQELKKYKLQPAGEMEDEGEKGKIVFETLRNPSGTGVLHSGTTSQNFMSNLPNFAPKFQSSEIIVSVEDQKRFEMIKAKDRIHIPRKLRRKGATYRIDDAYYDDDGEFLYRVPGMTGSQE